MDADSTRDESSSMMSSDDHSTAGGMLSRRRLIGGAAAIVASAGVIGGAGFAVAAIAPSRGRPGHAFAVAGDRDALVFWDDTHSSSTGSRVTASTGQTAVGHSPVRVRGLRNGRPVTFRVSAQGESSWPTDPVTPVAGDPGRIYYVDSRAGSDRNRGRTPDSPLRTVNGAMRMPLGPGDAVLFKRGAAWRHESIGIVRGRSGLPDRPITIAAYGRGAPPLFDASTTLRHWKNYRTRATNPELLIDGAIEGAAASGANVVATGWHGYTGTNGGVISTEKAVVDAHSTLAQKLTEGGGTLILDQSTSPLVAGIRYHWETRLATDIEGVARAAKIRLQIRAGNGATVPFTYLAPDGSWTAVETWFDTATPSASYQTFGAVFTPPVGGPILVQHRSDPRSAGLSVFVDTNSVKALSAPPTSPNTYRVPFKRARGEYPGMLWVDNEFRRVAHDPDRLPDRGWCYDGEYIYYRQDSGSPLTDGHRYQVPTTPRFAAIRSCSDWVLRDLDLRMYNAYGLSASSESVSELAARVVFAENRVRMCGSQIALEGVPDTNGAVNIQVAGDDCAIRGNVIKDSNTDSIYILGTGRISVTHNVTTLAIGSSADCCQVGDAGVRPQGPAHIAWNTFDNRGSISPKGALLMQGTGLAGSVIEYNKCYGGHFGIGVQSAGCEVRFNRIAYVGLDKSNSASWAAGFYSDYSGQAIGATSVHHNLIHDCLNGFNFTTGVRVAHVIADNTIADCTQHGFLSSVQWMDSSLIGNLWANPSASDGADLSGVRPGLASCRNFFGVDPRFKDKVDYVPQLAAATPTGWRQA